MNEFIDPAVEAEAIADYFRTHDRRAFVANAPEMGGSMLVALQAFADQYEPVREVA